MKSKAADILADLQQEEKEGKGKGPQGGRRGRGKGRQGKGTYIKHIGFCNSKF